MTETLISQPPPLEITGDIAPQWKKWRRRFGIYLDAIGGKTLVESRKCALLLHVIGDDAVEIFETFKVKDNERTLENILKKFEEHFVPKVNVTFERHKFFTCSQQPHESIDTYVTELHKLSATCDFGAISDSLIKDRIVCGIHSDILRERLLRETDLDLGSALNICRAAESSKLQSKSIGLAAENHPPTAGPNLSQDVNVFGVKSNYSGRPKKIDQSSNQSNTHSIQNSNRFNKVKPNKSHAGNVSHNVLCKRCGTNHVYGSCPAYHQQCNKCLGYNHFAKVCKSKSTNYSNKPRHINNVSVTDSEEIGLSENRPNLFIGVLNNDTRPSTNISETTRQCNSIVPSSLGPNKLISKTYNEWNVNLLIKDQRVKFRIDSGAQADILPVKIFNRLVSNNRRKNCLKVSQSKLTTYLGETLPVLGVCSFICTYGNVRKPVTFHVIDADSEPLLGLSTCTLFNLIKRVENVQSVELSDVVKSNIDLFQGIGKLAGKHHIEVDPSVKPVIHAPRKIPVTLEKPLRHKLDELERTGIIEKVIGPTDWVNSLVITVKKDNSLRLCLDPKPLNCAIKREHFQLPTLDEITSKLSGANVFSTLDALNGFWQIELDEESSKLCTFNTPYGRYKFMRLPYGISSAAEVFSQRFKQIFDDIEGVEPYVDDLIVWGKNQVEHDHRLSLVLERAREQNIRFNLSKCKFSKSSVKYMGHILSNKGIQVDLEKVSAINDMPKPSCKKDIERFLGMITYVNKFIPKMSDRTAPLRELLKSNRAFQFNSEQEQAFLDLKKLLVEQPVLQFYDVSKDVVLSVDSSSEGVAGVLLQNNLPVAYTSKALTETQKRWAQIEKEMFAIVHTCEKFHQYIYGKSVLVESDCKPLEVIYKKPLVSCPPRLQHLLIRLQRYDIEVQYKPGKELFIADTLSRAFPKAIANGSSDLDCDVEAQVCAVVSSLNVTDGKLAKIVEICNNDPEMVTLKEAVVNGWPSDKSLVPKNIKCYWNFKEEITEANGLLLKGNRLIIPNDLRKEMLNRIHYNHLGIEKCKSRARDCIFWPFMNKQITDMVSNCDVCLKHRNANLKEPMISHDIPKSPWQKVAADVFYLRGDNYLLLIDYFSKYVELSKLSSTKSDTIIAHCKSVFARHGIPFEFMSDNGIFNSTAFSEFCKLWDIKQTTSSPEYAQSNGQVERSIQSHKKMLKKVLESNGDPYLALLEFRNTPLYYGFYSPAQLLMGRRLRGVLPVKPNLLRPHKPKCNKAYKFLRNKQSEQSYYYNRGSKILKPLHVNDNVFVQRGKEWVPGTVTGYCNRPRSYYVKVGSGNTLQRNRRYLVKKSNESLDGSICYDHNPNSTYHGVTTPSPNPKVLKQNTQTKSPKSPSVKSNNSSTDSQTEDKPTNDLTTPVKSKFGRNIKAPKRLNL